MKRIIAILLTLILFVFLCGCGDNEALRLEKESLQSEIETLKIERDELAAIVTQEKVDKDVAKYIITFNIAQKHYIDLEAMLKDSMNDITISVPVDKEYYGSVNIGDVINDEFRWGSLILSGSYGEWDITIADKQIQ